MLWIAFFFLWQPVYHLLILWKLEFREEISVSVTAIFLQYCVWSVWCLWQLGPFFKFWVETKGYGNCLYSFETLFVNSSFYCLICFQFSKVLSSGILHPNFVWSFFLCSHLKVELWVLFYYFLNSCPQHFSVNSRLNTNNQVPTQDAAILILKIPLSKILWKQKCCVFNWNSC